MATTNVYPYKTIMKFHQIIASVVISFFLLCRLDAHGQFSSVMNSDGSIDRKSVIQDFVSYIDTLEVLPTTDEETREEIRKFNNLLFPYPYSFKIRIGEDGNKEIYTSEEQNRINDDCFNEMFELLKAKTQPAPPVETEEDQETPKNTMDISVDWRLIALAASIILFVVLVIVYSRMASRRKNSKLEKTPKLADRPIVTATNTQDSGIVVRRKTEAVMRKQSLDDAVDNSNYMLIDSGDFCADSSVRRIFIKNTCIKGIYNMYAEDLRNPDNPKEDGCMVLGRWVPDKATGEYDISLEEIVLPGDDAVFTEYELNFGFKISHAVSERLKKLRRENDRQYDLTCWVHSHPGLGVFFSNFDVNVQSQLKHPSHPNFLIAIVIDILTPKQDLGIFTFKHDASMNAKQDLTKFYSLEDWYQWALKSERDSFKQEDHYDTLSNAIMHDDSCRNIQLSNSIIIDMGFLMANPNDELVRWIHGFKNYQGELVSYVASQMSENGNEVSDEIIGAFVMVPHCSIPSVRKAVASRLKGISFVLVYSTSNGMLTSIPVINNELSTDDNYYAEQNFEDLKIWTRRKR